MSVNWDSAVECLQDFFVDGFCVVDIDNFMQSQAYFSITVAANREILFVGPDYWADICLLYTSDAADE